MSEKATWQYTFPHGYNHVIPVDAIVVKRNPKTVRIAVWSKRYQRLNYKNVKPEQLTPRDTHSVLDEQYAKRILAT